MILWATSHKSYIKEGIKEYAPDCPSISNFAFMTKRHLNNSVIPFELFLQCFIEIVII